MLPVDALQKTIGFGTVSGPKCTGCHNNKLFGWMWQRPFIEPVDLGQRVGYSLDGRSIEQPDIPGSRNWFDGAGPQHILHPREWDAHCGRDSAGRQQRWTLHCTSPITGVDVSRRQSRLSPVVGSVTELALKTS
jgi:hypothetical protein